MADKPHYKQQETVLKSINDLQDRLNRNVQDNFSFTEKVTGGLNKQLKIYNQIIDAGKEAIKNGKNVSGHLMRDIHLMENLTKKNLSIRDLEKEKVQLLQETEDLRKAGLIGMSEIAKKDADHRDSKIKQLKLQELNNAKLGTAGDFLGINLDFMNQFSERSKIVGKNIALQMLAFEASSKWIKSMWNSYTGFAKLVDQVGTTFGAAGKQGFGNELLLASANARGLGFGMEDVVNSTLELSNNFGYSFGHALSLTKTVADMSRILGVSMGDGAKFLGILTSIGGMSKETALNFATTADQLAIAGGVAPSQIMKDLTESGESFAIHAKDGGRNLLEAAVQARRLGTNLNLVTGVAEGLLDFQGSITKEYEAAVLTGKDLNFQEARRLALAKDYSGMTQVLLKQLGGVEEFNSMNVLQQRSIAQSLNMGVEDLAKWVQNAENASKAMDGMEQKKTFKELVGQDALSSLTNLQNSLAEIGAVLVQTLAPAMEMIIKPFAALAGWFKENAAALGFLKGVMVAAVPIITAVAGALVLKSIAAAWTAAMEFAGLTAGFGLPAAIALGGVATAGIIGAIAAAPRFANLPAGQRADIQSGIAIADAGESIVRNTDIDSMGNEEANKKLNNIDKGIGDVAAALKNLELKTIITNGQLNVVLTDGKA